MPNQGSSNILREYAFRDDPTPSGTLADGNGTRLPFETLDISPDPRVIENSLIAHKGQRSGVGRSGYDTLGSANGPFVIDAYDDWFLSLFQQKAWTKAAPSGFLLDGKIDTQAGLTKSSVKQVTMDTGTSEIPVGTQFKIGDVATSQVFTVTEYVPAVTTASDDRVVKVTWTGDFPTGKYAENAPITFTNVPSVIVNGFDRKSLAVEISIPKGDTGDRAFNLYRGVEINSASIAMEVGTNVVANFGLVGMDVVKPGAATAMDNDGNGKVADLASTVIVASSEDLGRVSLTNDNLTSANLHFRNLNIDFGIAGKDRQDQIASNAAAGISRGAIRPVISGQLYITEEFSKIMNLTRDGGAVRVEIGPMGTKADHKYKFVFPNCQFTQSPPEFSTEGSAFQNVQLMPVYSTSGFAYDGVGTAEIHRLLA